MDADQAIKLPVIDFSGQYMVPGTLVWESVKIQVRNALEEFGCFEALFDKIPLELRKAILDALPELFDLPFETKVRNSFTRPARGYISGQYRSKSSVYESTVVLDSTTPEKVESFTNLMWPNGNTIFSETVLTYSEQLSELDKIIRRMVFESFGLEKHMAEHMDSTDYFLKLMKYESAQTNDTKVDVLATHTDRTLVTILHQSQVKGLEVLTKDDQWLDVNFSRPDSFVVVIGDTFHAWMNGRLHAPTHRVRISGSCLRYSVGLFSYSRQGYIIKVPEELVDEKHPLLYKHFDFFEYLAFAHTHAEIGLKLSSAIKAYCGV